MGPGCPGDSRIPLMQFAPPHTRQRGRVNDWLRQAPGTTGLFTEPDRRAGTHTPLPPPLRPRCHHLTARSRSVGGPSDEQASKRCNSPGCVSAVPNPDSSATHDRKPEVSDRQAQYPASVDQGLGRRRCGGWSRISMLQSLTLDQSPAASAAAR